MNKVFLRTQTSLKLFFQYNEVFYDKIVFFKIKKFNGICLKPIQQNWGNGVRSEFFN